MDNKIDTFRDVNVSDELLRDLLDSEIILIGGGEAACNGY